MDFVSHGLGVRLRSAEEPIEFRAGIRHRHGAGPVIIRGLVRHGYTGSVAEPDFRHGTPPESTIPHYVYHLYNYTHRFVVFLAVFFLVWLFLKRPVWELDAWGLHILTDMPLHSYAFFPTPVLWPLSDWKFDGWEWMAPGVLIPNFMLLSLLYAWYVRSLLDKSRKDAQPQAVSRPSTCEDPQLKKMT